MATTANITTTYAGEYFGQWITAALQSMSSAEHVTIKNNIRVNEVVKKLVDNVSLSAENCDFTPTGTTTITERIITPVRMELARQFCKNDFYNDWDASVGTGGWLDGLGNDFESFVTAHYVMAVAAHLETKLHQGATGSGDLFDGFATLFAADGDVNDVTGTTISAANVVAEMAKVVDSGIANTAIFSSDVEQPKLYVNRKTAHFYLQAMQALGYLDQYYASEVPLVFQGVEVAVCNGIADDVMYLAQPSNLWVGTAQESEWGEIKVKDMEETDLSDNVRLRMKLTFGCQHGIGADIVYYS